jgi:hypothetical protein
MWDYDSKLTAFGQEDAIPELVEAAVLVPFAALEEVAVGELPYCVIISRRGVEAQRREDSLSSRGTTAVTVYKL